MQMHPHDRETYPAGHRTTAGWPARRRRQWALLLAVVLTVSGCKGWLGSGSPIFDPDGGDDDAGQDPDTSTQQAEGRWTGLAGSGATLASVDMVVLPGGYAYALQRDVADAYGSISAAQLQVDGSTVTSSTGSHFIPVGQGFFERDGTVTFSGAVDTGTSLELTLNVSVDVQDTSTALPLVFDSSWNTDASLVRLSGNYSRSVADTGDQQLSIDGNGVITGSSGSCTLNGQALVFDTIRNLYTVTLSFGSECPFAGSMTGWALVDEEDGSKSGLTLFVRSAEGQDLFWFRGALD